MAKLEDGLTNDEVLVLAVALGMRDDEQRRKFFERHHLKKMTFPELISFGESITARQVNLSKNQGESSVSQIGQAQRNTKKCPKCKLTGHNEKDCKTIICETCSKIGHTKEFCIANPTSVCYGKSIEDARLMKKAAVQAAKPAAKTGVTKTIF